MFFAFGVSFLCGRYVNTFYKLGKTEQTAKVNLEFIKLYNDYSQQYFRLQGKNKKSSCNMQEDINDII